jgi:hypothetical protein
MTGEQADELIALIGAATEAGRTLERLVSRGDPSWEDAFNAEMAARGELFRWIGAHTCRWDSER